MCLLEFGSFYVFQNEKFRAGFVIVRMWIWELILCLLDREFGSCCACQNMIWELCLHLSEGEFRSCLCVCQKVNLVLFVFARRWIWEFCLHLLECEFRSFVCVCRTLNLGVLLVLVRMWIKEFCLRLSECEFKSCFLCLSECESRIFLCLSECDFRSFLGVCLKVNWWVLVFLSECKLMSCVWLVRRWIQEMCLSESEFGSYHVY